MYCYKCGKELSDDAKKCVECGAAVQNGIPKRDKPSAAFTALSLLMPYLGFILYLIYEDKKPLRARSIKIGIISAVVIYILIFILVFALQVQLTEMI